MSCCDDDDDDSDLAGPQRRPLAEHDHVLRGTSKGSSSVHSVTDKHFMYHTVCVPLLLHVKPVNIILP